MGTGPSLCGFLWPLTLLISATIGASTVLPGEIDTDLLENLDVLAKLDQVDRLDIGGGGFGPTGQADPVEELVARYAPILHLHPDDVWRPGDVESFIKGVRVLHEDGIIRRINGTLPTGPETKRYYLIAELPQGLGTASVRYPAVLGGTPPSQTPPVYVTVTRCGAGLDTNSLASAQEPGPPSFHATYWVFHPFNQGKLVSGKLRGNHVGDWEHASIRVERGLLTDVFISSHNFGAYYAYSPFNNTLQFVKYDYRGYINPSPHYPQHIFMDDTHPILYVALGSHGIWPSPGDHKYFGYLSDITARGPAWNTWRHLVHLNREQPQWLQYRGRWGNPHDCVRLIMALCPLTKGPQGIVRRPTDFQCGAPRPKPDRSIWSRVFGWRRRRRAATRATPLTPSSI